MLDLSGTGGVMAQGAEKQYGKALFFFEEGAWKLDEENWSNQPYSEWSPHQLSPFEL